MKNNLKFLDLWNKRSLIMTLAIIDLKSRYRHSVLGIAWSFLEPLFILTILNLVFSNLLKADIENFPIFLILNLVLFNMFTRGTSMSSESILGRAGIIQSVSLQREIFPLASTITASIMMLIEFSIVVIFVAVFQFVPTSTVFLLLAIIPLLFILTFGISLALSTLNVHYRDTRIIWTVIIQGLFFFSPIVYKMEFLPDAIADIAKIFPLAHLIEMSHNALLYNMLPSDDDLMYVVGTCFLTLFVGWIIFRKLNPSITEAL
jgi:lipopolysaccharide transport system permease protein